MTTLDPCINDTDHDSYVPRIRYESADRVHSQAVKETKKDARGQPLNQEQILNDRTLRIRNFYDSP